MKLPTCLGKLAVLLATKFPAVDQILAGDYHGGDRGHVRTYNTSVDTETSHSEYKL